MKIIGNIIWFLFGGLLLALEYFILGLLWCITIIGIPFGLQLFKIAGLSLWPFGKVVCHKQQTAGCLSTGMNLLWVVLGGLFLALEHAILGLFFCITIIGIPFGKQHFKLASIALTPFGKKIMSAKESKRLNIERQEKESYIIGTQETASTETTVTDEECAEEANTSALPSFNVAEFMFDSNKSYYIGGVIAVLAVVIGIFTCSGSKKGSGEFAGKPISELFPEVEKDADAGDIPDEPLTFTWDTPWCGGDVTIVRKADENQLVIMYSTSSYDPNTLYLGNYQNGQYVFCYEIPVGSLDYDETTTGISLKNNAPEDILYYGTFGKDVAKTVEYEWGTETSVDWDKVTEAQLAEIFAAAIAEGPGEPIIITAKSIKAAKEGNNSDEETSEEEIEYETITTDLDQLQELIERTRGVVEECERNGESTYSTICDDVRKALESLNENVSLMSDAQRERFNALSQQAQELMEHADRISVEAPDTVAAVEIDEDDIM